MNCGHVGFCSVMGQGGEMYGLAVYVDGEGLTSMLKTLSGHLVEDDYYDQRSLLFTLEDREELDKEDLELIKELNLPLRGRRQWPMFRSHSLGLYPWRLNQDEVLFFIKVLEQALVVCQRAKEQPNLLLPKTENEIFARQWNHSRWEDGELSIVPQRQEKSAPILAVNELELLRVKKAHQMVPAVFEFDVKVIAPFSPSWTVGRS